MKTCGLINGYYWLIDKIDWSIHLPENDEKVYSSFCKINFNTNSKRKLGSIQSLNILKRYKGTFYLKNSGIPDLQRYPFNLYISNTKSLL